MSVNPYVWAPEEVVTGNQLSENFNDFINFWNDLVLIPIGGLSFWHKNLTGTPDLPEGWVEVNGQTIDDPESLYDGVTIPNINGQNRFLYGGSTDGGTGGSATHTHTNSGSSGGARWTNFPGSSFRQATEESNLPPYMNVVVIMRIK